MRGPEDRCWALKRKEKRIRTAVDIEEEGKEEPERSKEQPSLLVGVSPVTYGNTCCA